MLRKMFYGLIIALLCNLSTIAMEQVWLGTKIATQIVWAIGSLYLKIKAGRAAKKIADSFDQAVQKMPHQNSGSNNSEFDNNDDPDTSQDFDKDPPHIEGLKSMFAGEIPAEVSEIIDFLHNPSKFQRFGISMPKGILLIGPPGTGKTTIARAIARYAGCAFFAVNGSDFIEVYVGTGAKRVRDLFEKARESIKSGKKKAAIIFIDEIDAIGCKRESESGGASREYQQTLIQLLSLMDGFQQHETIIVIAATNRPEVLDPALLRPGRFDRKVLIGLPNLENRIAILKHYMDGKLFDAELDIIFIARLTQGFSGAQLKNLVNEAAIRAARQDAPMVKLEHFMQVLKEDVNFLENKQM